MNDLSKEEEDELIKKLHISSKIASEPNPSNPPFAKIMAANRAEIAVRIRRASTELNIPTVSIYGAEDKYSAHRWGCDESYLLPPSGGNGDPSKDTPAGAYLNITNIINIAKGAGVDAIHPGYGFLSESPELARACEENGIVFVGPTVENLQRFSDKTSARAMAIEAGVSVVPGTDGPVVDPQDAVSFVEEYGLPVIIKASMGGGGKGMRVVRKMEDLIPFFESASSEAKASFGDGSCFIERYIANPRHIEIQIIGDGKGNVIHLWERDCSVQRRHQKVLEIAPAWNLPPETRVALHRDAVRLTSGANYKNAGTVEFLVDEEGRHYFIEVNPRVQVEHTVTEEVTGVDIVRTQILIASGYSLEDIGLIQSEIQPPRGVALQARITTEDPERDFAPDTGSLSAYRHSLGPGIRVDGIGYPGMTVLPYYDSLMVKYTARAGTWAAVVGRLLRALLELRIRGVKTNTLFLINVLSHPDFVRGTVTTSFIDQNPSLLKTSISKWDHKNRQSSSVEVYRVEKYLKYVSHLAVNGHPKSLGANPDVLHGLSKVAVPVPDIGAIQKALGDTTAGNPWRKILLEEGPEAMAKAVRECDQLLVMDTTWRDAHQSLLATRMRTWDLARSAEATGLALGPGVFSLEMWGGATFDVSMRFLRECPWERLKKLRSLIPDVPFQMLLRGANAVGYTSYPDNVVYEFCKEAHAHGIDIFRVFDSLNYIENMELGIKAALASGGFVEGAISYTGDVTDTTTENNKYDLEYYLSYARQLVSLGIHSIAIKDMAGLLTPKASTLLVSSLRSEFPSLPIHVHTHDTAGTGIASMLAARAAGADVVDCAMDAMAGMTSQPSLGALLSSLDGDDDTLLNLDAIQPLNRYWEDVRTQYLPFESGQLSGSSDVYKHEIPGGQYTNLLFQSRQLGLSGKFDEIKKKYAEANLLMGDIPKVTPSSKVVGDMAQFMVAQNLDMEDVLERASTLAFPNSVVEYFMGYLGQPPGGFPEPLRSRILAGRGVANGDDGGDCYNGRPGANLSPYDFDTATSTLREAYGEHRIEFKDVLSHALYPDVFQEWLAYEAVYGRLDQLPTHLFLRPMSIGDAVEFDVAEKGRRCYLEMTNISERDDSGMRMVSFLVNGELRQYRTTDDTPVMIEGDGSSSSSLVMREKVDPMEKGQVGSPMPGVIVAVNVHDGNEVKEGETLFKLSAMKMETSITATKTGLVKRVLVNSGDNVEGDDLLAVID